MKIPTIQNLTVAMILCVLGLVSAASAQTTSECGENDKDCPKSEKRSIDTDNEKASRPVTTKKIETAKLVSNFSGVRAQAAQPDPDRATTPNPPRGESSPQTPGDDAQALAKKLSNPVASLISLPFQSNFDFGMGPAKKGFRYTLNIQPVIPMSLGPKWNLISRTIIPVMGQDNVIGTTAQFGLGDIVQSFFFSPNKTEPIIWGFGPQFLIPTATSQYLGTQKFGVGLTGLVLKQQGKWTVGALINHMWSVAGKSTRADVSLTYIQPFISYTTKTAWTYNLNTETTYDWVGKTSNVPIHFTVSKLVRFGKQPVSIGGSLRCWAHSSPGGPQWCGFRLVITPLFPKK